MRNIKAQSRTGHRRVERLRPVFDLLEARTALSGSTIDSGFFGGSSQFGSPTSTTPLAIASTTPANLTTITSSPTTLTVTFNKPLNGFSLNIGDFELVHVNSDGSTTPLTAQEAQMTENLDFSNPMGDQIDLTLSRPLVEGRYQLILLGNNQLAGTDGSVVADDGQNEVVTDFTIAPPVSSQKPPTNLGTISSTLDEVAGNLSLLGDPGAVNEYELTLGPGHHWSLGLAVDSQSLGSPLTTTLSLFNSEHQLVATSSTGLQNDPGDPFLFAGLAPGTYYVGISARGNVPESDGTYDPAGSNLSSQSNDPSGGSYQLQAVAEVADQPAQVLGDRLDQADPLSTAPTGLTLQFSAALQLGNLEDQMNPPLQLVDQNGTTWGVTTVGYDPSLGQLQVVFNQALPAGSYTLKLTGPTSLLDLADDVPVAPGLAAGDLARFRVGPKPQPTPGDLGPVYPGVETSELTTSLSIGPDSSTTGQFVIVEPGVYAIEGVNPSSGITYTLTGSNGSVIASGPQNSTTGELDLMLQDGVYTLTFSNRSDQASQLQLTILHKDREFSELMNGGISQGAALSLRLVTPQANFGLTPDPSLTTTAGSGSSGAATTPETSGSGAAASDSTRASSGSEETLATAAGMLSPSAAQTLLASFGPVGLPSAQSNQISVVGSTSTSGTFALASNGSGLSPGLIGIPESSSVRPGNESSIGLADEPVEIESKPDSSRVSSTDAGLLARSPQSRRADDQTLAGADWISRLVENTLGWLGEVSGASNPPVVEVATAPVVESRELANLLEEEPRLESTWAASPIGIGVVVMGVFYRYRSRFFATRLDQAPSSTPRRSKSRIYAGPHRSSKKLVISAPCGSQRLR